MVVVVIVTMEIGAFATIANKHYVQLVDDRPLSDQPATPDGRG